MPTTRSTPTRCSSWRRCPSRWAATVVAHQVGQNAIGWDTPIVEKLPWFALSDPAVTKMVTVGDMYSHRSGLPDHAGDLLEDIGYDRRYVLEHLRQLSARSVPNLLRLHQLRAHRGCRGGGRRRGQVVGGPQPGRAVRAAGHDVDQFAVRRLRGQARPGGRAHPRRRRVPAATTCATPRPQSPAGGVSSSVNDMTQWLTMVLANGSYDGKQIVDPKALLPAITPQIVSSSRRPSRRCGRASTGTGSTSGPRRRPARSSATPAPSSSARAPTS